MTIIKMSIMAVIIITIRVAPTHSSTTYILPLQLDSWTSTGPLITGYNCNKALITHMNLALFIFAMLCYEFFFFLPRFSMSLSFLLIFPLFSPLSSPPLSYSSFIDLSPLFALSFSCRWLMEWGGGAESGLSPPMRDSLLPRMHRVRGREERARERGAQLKAADLILCIIKQSHSMQHPLYIIHAR